MYKIDYNRITIASWCFPEWLVLRRSIATPGSSFLNGGAARLENKAGVVGSTNEPFTIPQISIKRWYPGIKHSQSWLVYDIVLLTLIESFWDFEEGIREPRVRESCQAEEPTTPSIKAPAELLDERNNDEPRNHQWLAALKHSKTQPYKVVNFVTFIIPCPKFGLDESANFLWHLVGKDTEYLLMRQASMLSGSPTFLPAGWSSQLMRLVGSCAWPGIWPSRVEFLLLAMASRFRRFRSFLLNTLFFLQVEDGCYLHICLKFAITPALRIPKLDSIVVAFGMYPTGTV